MFDIIGKRRWFFALLAGRHDPRPDLHPPDPVHGRRPPVHDRLHRRDRGRSGSRIANVTPDQVEAVFAEHGLEATAVIDRRRLHRDPDRAPRRPAAAGAAADPGPDAGACRPASPVRVARGIDRAVGERRHQRRRRPRAHQPRPSASPSASAVAPSAVRRAPSPSASPSAAPAGTVELPDRRDKLGEVAGRPRGPSSARSPRRQPDDDRRGGQLRPDQPGADPDPRRLDRDPALDHLPVPRREVRRRPRSSRCSTT